MFKNCINKKNLHVGCASVEDILGLLSESTEMIFAALRSDIQIFGEFCDDSLVGRFLVLADVNVLDPLPFDFILLRTLCLSIIWSG